MAQGPSACGKHPKLTPSAGLAATGHNLVMPDNRADDPVRDPYHRLLGGRLP